MHRSLLRDRGIFKLAGKVQTICKEKVVPEIEKLGYDVVEIEYSKKSDGMNLVFYIDHDNGITMEDCEKVSREIDDLLEEVNPTDDQPYILSVSSPGIDRPLKTERDFKRNLNKEIEVTLFAKINGKKKFVGTLTGFDETSFAINSNGDEIKFSKQQVAHIVPVIKF